MEGPKQRLEAKLIAFQQQIIRANQAGKEREKACREREDALFIELFEVLDGFENVFRNLEQKQQEFDKTTRQALKSFEALQRKLLRLLAERGVEPIELPEGKAVVGLCKVVETRPTPETTEPGSILVRVRQGYRREDQVLRPVEVITAEGGTSGEDVPGEAESRSLDNR
jgi:molecular chaperone GrpE